jgi:hypothetical protein
MKLLTTPEVAEKFGVTGARVRQWYAQGRIKAVLVTPSGQPLYSPALKHPSQRKRGPKTTGKKTKR